MNLGDNSGRLVLRDDAVSWAPTENGAVVILDLRSSRYLNLNPSASMLWNRLVGGANYEVLVDALVEQFGIEGDRAQEDVSAFVADLRDRDLLLANA